MFFFTVIRNIILAILMLTFWTLPLQAKSHNLSLLMQRGHNAIMGGQNQLAVDVLGKVIRSKYADKKMLAEAFLKRGVAFQRLGFMAKSITNFNFAEGFKVLPKPALRDLYYNRSKSYEIAGLNAKALEDQQKLRKIDFPEARRITLSEPTVTASVKPAKKIVRNMQRAIGNQTISVAKVRLSPAETKLEQGHQAILAGKNKKAVKILTRLIRQKKIDKVSLAKAYFRRGVAYQRRGKYTASISDFTNADDLKSLNIKDKRDLFYNRAASYKAVGMAQLAMADTRALQKIDGISPTNTDLDVPTMTASIKNGGVKAVGGKGKKKRHLRTYIAKPRADTLAKKMQSFFRKSQK